MVEEVLGRGAPAAVTGTGCKQSDRCGSSMIMIGKETRKQSGGFPTQWKTFWIHYRKKMRSVKRLGRVCKSKERDRGCCDCWNCIRTDRAV